jgi:hypothetical protein
MIASAAAFPGRPRPRPHGGPAPSQRYERRRPEKTPLHKIVSENLESWLPWREAAERPVPGYVEEELRGYLECGILCFGFARALCTGCGQAFVVAFSCKGRGVCPSCNGRHMAQTAAHDGVFVPAPAQAAGDAPPAFLPARPINQADLAALTERVRRRVIRWFRLARLLDAAAAADMLAWVNSGFSVDANVRITLIDRDVPSYSRSLEHLLRYCARPPFALERLSVLRGPDGRIARIRSVLPRHKAATWVGPGRCRKSTRPGDTGVVELTPFAGRMPARRSSQTSALATTAQGGRGQGWHCRRNVSSTVWWISSRRRGSTGTAITEYSRRITSSGGPSRRWQ